MESLLDRTRVIGELVETSAEPAIDLSELTTALASVTASSAVIIDMHGRVLAHAPRDGTLVADVAAGQLGRDIAERLARVEHREANIRDETIAGLLRRQGRGVAAALPIRGAGQRLGTLVLVRAEGRYDDRDLVLAEFAATIVALQLLRPVAATAESTDERRREAVRTALGALSFSELEAVAHILAELRGDEGIVVASKVADRVGITRSVIVNALRKLESGLIIHSRSLGMKGTYIKILNPRLLDELARVRTQTR